METNPTIITATTVPATSDQQPGLPDPPPERAPRQAVAKPRQQAAGLYDRLGQTVAYATGLAISLALWAGGAFFTLTALDALGVNVSSPAWWLLPLGITGAEIWLMPRSGTRWPAFALFGLVLAVDVASSWYGLIDTLGGKFMPFGPGFNVPTSGMPLHVFAVASALVLAFAPEKLGKWASAELLKVWR